MPRTQFGYGEEIAEFRFVDSEVAHRCHIQFEREHFVAAVSGQWIGCHVHERCQKFRLHEIQHKTETGGEFHLSNLIEHTLTVTPLSLSFSIDRM